MQRTRGDPCERSSPRKFRRTQLFCGAKTQNTHSTETNNKKSRLKQNTLKKLATTITTRAHTLSRTDRNCTFFWLPFYRFFPLFSDRSRGYDRDRANAHELAQHQYSRRNVGVFLTTSNQLTRQVRTTAVGHPESSSSPTARVTRSRSQDHKSTKRSTLEHLK